MSAAPASRQHPQRRAQALHALGIIPWVRRTVPPTTTPADPAPSAGAAVVAPSVCAVLLPEGCSARELDLIGRALAAYGTELARAPRILVSGGKPAAPVPPVRAYLVFGQAQAHALGRELPAAAMERCHVVLADDPSEVLASGAGKRRLWTALRQLRRMVAEGA